MAIKTPEDGRTSTTHLGEQVFADTVTLQKPSAIGSGSIGPFASDDESPTMWGVSPRAIDNYALYAGEDLTILNVPAGGTIDLAIGDVPAMHISGDGKISFPGVVAAPASASDAGVTGQIAFTASFIYVCVATNTWVRAVVETW